MTLPLVVDHALLSLRDAAVAVDRAPSAADYTRLASRPPVHGTVYATLLQHRDALAALGDAVHAAPYKAPPVAPVLYVRPRNTWSACGAPLVVPHGVEAVQVGPSLGLVIGRTACRVTRAEALAHVAGVVVVVDVTLPHASLHRPSVRQRCHDGFCPIGPWITAARHVGNLDALAMRVDVDDTPVLHANTSGQVRDCATLLADVTSFMTLHPGDVLATGVPHSAPLVRPRQRVTVEIEDLGRMTHTVVAGAPAA